MDTENAATIASARNCADDRVEQVLGPHGLTGAPGNPGISPQEIEAARRHLTLAALRWQVRLDAHSVEVS